MSQLTPTEGILYARLIAAVEAGEECPKNDALCELLGHASPSSVSPLLNRIAKKGLIVITRFQNGRDIFIPSLGRGTAEFSGSRTGHWRDTSERSQRPDVQKGKMPGDPLTAKAAEILRRQAVPRDPCPRCATRRDIGCSHYPAPAQAVLA
ncbi:MAG: helix-turn-helix domain-containing protein [Sphingomonas sp.]